MNAQFGYFHKYHIYIELKVDFLLLYPSTNLANARLL